MFKSSRCHRGVLCWQSGRVLQDYHRFWRGFLQRDASMRAFGWAENCSRNLTDPRNRNHKSLAIANRNFEVTSFCRRNRSEIAVLQVLSESQWFLWVAIAVASGLRFEVAAIRVTKLITCLKKLNVSGAFLAQVPKKLRWSQKEAGVLTTELYKRPLRTRFSMLSEEDCLNSSLAGPKFTKTNILNVVAISYRGPERRTLKTAGKTAPGQTEIGGGQKGTPERGREEKRQKMSWQIGPLPLQPHFVRGPPPPLPWMSSEVQKRGKLVREVRGPKDKPTGVRGTLCHDIFCPVPFPAPLLTFTDENNRKTTRSMQNNCFSAQRLNPSEST